MPREGACAMLNRPAHPVPHSSVAPHAPSPPILQVRYMFSLPYTAKLQPDGIRYPVVFHR